MFCLFINMKAKSIALLRIEISLSLMQSIIVDEWRWSEEESVKIEATWHKVVNATYLFKNFRTLSF